MQLKFEKMKPSRSFQHVADQIQAAILDGSLKSGDKLPAEMKLKDMFDTSRGTIREALRVLEQKGLINIKTGVSGGAIVKEISTQPITEGLDLLMQYQKVSVEHLSEFRHEIEGTVTALAAERATKKDIQRLKKILAEARKQLEKGINGRNDFFRTDVKLHIELAKIAKNPIFEAVLQMVHENILGRWLKFSPTDENVFQENYEDLCDIVAAVERGESNKARVLAHDHVSRFYRYMERGKGKV
ncbi:MAG: FadR family transcriptional regulator [Desulfobacterales bacterium]|nr:MAG: FadR family transcriptional regulator [Desulfobacterales bacterium]